MRKLGTINRDGRRISLYARSASRDGAGRRIAIQYYDDGWREATGYRWESLKEAQAAYRVYLRAGTWLPSCLCPD